MAPAICRITISCPLLVSMAMVVLSFSVEDFAQPFLHVPDNQMGEDATAVLCDPQTSGGMLCAIPSEAAATFEEEFAARCGRTPAKIGRVIEGESGHIHVVE